MCHYLWWQTHLIAKSILHNKLGVTDWLIVIWSNTSIWSNAHNCIIQIQMPLNWPSYKPFEWLVHQKHTCQNRNCKAVYQIHEKDDSSYDSLLQIPSVSVFVLGKELRAGVEELGGGPQREEELLKPCVALWNWVNDDNNSDNKRRVRRRSTNWRIAKTLCVTSA